MSASHGTIYYSFYSISGLVGDAILPTLVALIIAFGVRRLVPRFRSIPTYDLVIRTLYVLIILGGLGFWGAYSQDKSSSFTSEAQNTATKNTPRSFQAGSGERITSTREEANMKSVRGPDHIAEVTAVITRSGQYGFDATEVEFDHQTLAALDDWVEDTIISKLKVQYAERGLKQRDFSKLVKSTSSAITHKSVI
jgi:hypothetical protein